MKKYKRALSAVLCLTILLGVLAGLSLSVGANELPIVPPHEHTWDAGTVTREPTCTAAGVKTYTCSCGATKTESIPATGHSYTYSNNGNGTHTVSCTKCEYSATESHTYTNGVCVCGNRETGAQLAIVSASPRIHENVNLIYTVTVPAGYTDPYMVFSFNGTTATVRDYTTKGDKLEFTFANILPQCMGDKITATLYATANGAQQSVTKADYSVRDYCVNMLARTGDEAISASLRTLLSDLLVYGAAAQKYTNYKTNALVAPGSDLVNPTYSSYTPLSGLAPRFETNTADVCWVSASLTLTSSVAMNFRFRANSTKDLIVYVTAGGRTQTFTSFTSLGGDLYEISFTDIGADEFGEDVTAVFERDNEQIGNSVTYSVNTYIQSKQSDSDAKLAALVQALYNYGAAASAYVK